MPLRQQPPCSPPAVNTTTSDMAASCCRNWPRPGRSTTNTPPGFKLDPTPTRWVFIEGGSTGARLGVKEEIRVPSRSSRTVRRPA